MKTITYSLFLLLLTSSAFAQSSKKTPVMPFDSTTGKYIYSNVVEVHGKSASQLYSSAREFIAKTFVSANDVIQLEDKDANKLLAKGNISIKPTMYLLEGWVKFTLTIETKEGKYRYFITDMSHESVKSGYSGGRLENQKPACSSLAMAPKGWKQIKEQSAESFEDLVRSMEQFVGRESKDDW